MPQAATGVGTLITSIRSVLMISAFSVLDLAVVLCNWWNRRQSVKKGISQDALHLWLAMAKTLLLGNLSLFPFSYYISLSFYVMSTWFICSHHMPSLHVVTCEQHRPVWAPNQSSFCMRWGLEFAHVLSIHVTACRAGVLRWYLDSYLSNYPQFHTNTWMRFCMMDMFTVRSGSICSWCELYIELF